MKTDIAIIGGGAIGAAAAYYLRTHPKAGSVALIERDPAFKLASTPRASGGVRRLFSLPENIALSNFSIPFFERFDRDMAVDGEPAVINFRKGGYLFIVPPRSVSVLESNHRVQTANGVRAHLLDPKRLKDTFPSMIVDDLGAGVHSPDDGWLDPHSVLLGFRRKVRALGTQMIDDEVVGIEGERARTTRVLLKSGRTIEADHIVIAAGAWSKEICRMIGWEIPVEPMRRYEHYFECEEPIEPTPYIKDVNRLAFRPEGKGYTGGVPTLAEPRGFNFDIDHEYFDTVVWPALATRFPQFERTRERNVMSGLYDQCELDASPIIGPWTGGLDNVYLMAGFSGHGLMHAPGCGRAIAELILDGGYQSIDLTPFGWQRVVDNKPYAEKGII